MGQGGPEHPTLMPAQACDYTTGHFTALGHEPYNYVTVYIEVDDVADYLAKAEALGGKTLVPPVEIPNGTFAWFNDPDGNAREGRATGPDDTSSNDRRAGSRQRRGRLSRDLARPRGG